MRSKIKILLNLLMIIVLGVSCVSSEIGSVGTLPKNWWDQPRGVIERVLRKESQGYYSNVLVFIGMSDSVNNYSQSQAIDLAKLDADTKLSQFIISKTTNIVRGVANANATRIAENSPEEINRLVEEIADKMESSISIAQFSSFMIEGYHTQPAEINGVPYYIGWVCCTIQDDLVDAIQKIQEKAFESVIKTTIAYAPVMQQIQEDSAKMIVEAFRNEMAGIIESAPQV